MMLVEFERGSERREGMDGRMDGTLPPARRSRDRPSVEDTRTHTRTHITYTRACPSLLLLPSFLFSSKNLASYGIVIVAAAPPLYSPRPTDRLRIRTIPASLPSFLPS